MDDYREKGSLLLQDPTNKQLFEMLLRDKPNMFYRGTCGAFVGLGSACPEPIKDIFERELSKRVTIEQFVYMLSKVGLKRWAHSSEYSLRSFSDKLQLADNRMSELLKECEEEVRKRLVENYLKGIQQYIIDKQVEEEGTSVL